MATRFPPSRPSAANAGASFEGKVSALNHSALVPARQIGSRQWRCSCCDKLLGLREGSRVHVRFSRGHEVFASLPAQMTCRGCGTLNDATPENGAARPR